MFCLFVSERFKNASAEISQSAITIVTREGEVKASNRVVLKTRCALDLRQFPLDKQMCPICFSSCKLLVIKVYLMKKYERKSIVFNRKFIYTNSLDHDFPPFKHGISW